MDVRIRIVGPGWDGFEAVERLLWAALYRDFGVVPESDWMQHTPDSTYVLGLTEGDDLLGAARLLGPVGSPQRQLRQVAVDPRAQRAGVGMTLVRTCELRAREQGAEEIWLNARDTAIAFYERLGYVAEGDVFVSELTGIPHRFMRRRLDDASETRRG